MSEQKPIHIPLADIDDTPGWRGPDADWLNASAAGQTFHSAYEKPCFRENGKEGVHVVLCPTAGHSKYELTARLDGIVAAFRYLLRVSEELDEWQRITAEKRLAAVEKERNRHWMETMIEMALENHEMARASLLQRLIAQEFGGGPRKKEPVH